MYDYFAQSIDIKEDVYDRLIKKKKQEKIEYDKGIKTQYFTHGDFVLFEDLISYLKKLIEQWFGRDYSISYIIKRFHK